MNINNIMSAQEFILGFFFVSIFLYVLIRGFETAAVIIATSASDSDEAGAIHASEAGIMHAKKVLRESVPFFFYIAVMSVGLYLVFYFIEPSLLTREAMFTNLK